ncbi:MAG TPA: aldo/keto reductase [Gemmatimonadaceae bacterium]|jgi:aryl-alcohol dehydrogenase-like predicted oxidoreductase|nr:aldo/keto reductase [Gemmatimonadaceae bacterium]
MEFRQLGRSGLRVPALAFGTATFGGGNDFYRAWGSTDVTEAKRLVDLCLDAGVSFFDTANSYSTGMAEEILGAALAGRRQEVILASKATFPMGSGPNDAGSSRHFLRRACEDSLRRLRTDHIDVYYMHGFDENTPIEETLKMLDTLVTSGKVSYVACSNFSGWQVMKSLAISDRYGWPPYVAHQAYYSLVAREYEWELMPLAIDQGIGTVAWSPLAGGALSGKVRRGQPIPEGSRVAQLGLERAGDVERLFDIVGVLEDIAKETGKTVSQVAINWVLYRPTVASVVIGARSETQLRENLAAAAWRLDAAHVARLDAVSNRRPIYPYWHQRLNPRLVTPAV